MNAFRASTFLFSPGLRYGASIIDIPRRFSTSQNEADLVGAGVEREPTETCIHGITPPVGKAPVWKSRQVTVPPKWVDFFLESLCAQSGR